MNIETHFNLVDDYLHKKTKLSNRKLLAKINECKSNNTRIITSLKEAYECLTTMPWIDEKQFTNMCCILNKPLYDELLTRCCMKRYTVCDNHWLYLGVECNDVLQQAKKIMGFASLYFKTVESTVRLCFFGFHKLVVKDKEYHLRLMWAKCGHLSHLNEDKYMIMASVTSGNESNENAVSRWMIDCVATFVVNDNTATDLKRFAVYNDSVNNFSIEMLNFQKHIQPFIFNKAYGVLDPYSDEMRDVVDELFEQAIVSSGNVNFFVEQLYLTFSSKYLSRAMTLYNDKLEKFRERNGYWL